jgi:radical SAM superfamily enzyme YgiQ (UPF0313 family)
MDTLFVYSLERIISAKRPLGTPEQINFGLSYLSALLKQHGFSTKLAVLGSNRVKTSTTILFNMIENLSPKIIAFTAVATQYWFIKLLAEKIKIIHPDIFLIIGGAHATLCPEEVMDGPFDAICIGEGEIPLLELATCVKGNLPIPDNTKNIWLRKGDTFIKNETRPFLWDLDSLPIPDREMWFEWIKETKDSRFSILLGRGCPFQCSYCSNHALSLKATGCYVRFRSPDNIINEIRKLHELYPHKKEYFLEVETLNINNNWVFELCNKLEELNSSLDKKLIFGTNIRITPNSDFDSLFSACANAGIKQFTVGLESGSERIRKEIMRRNYSNQDVIRMAESARKHGCTFSFQNMIGLPTETEDEFLETVKMNRICKPIWHCLSIFHPYPGTDLARTAQEMGLYLNKKGPSMDRDSFNLNIPTFPKSRLKYRFYFFEYDVYYGIRPLYKILALSLIKLLRANRFTSQILSSTKRTYPIQYLKNLIRGDT